MIKKKLYRFKNFLKRNEWYYTYDIKIRKVSLGDSGNEWVICPVYINSESVFYSFGAGMNISFDTEMEEKFGLKVCLFDPTPKSIKFVKEQKLNPNYVFEEIGIADFTGNASFYLPLNPEYVSATIEKQNDSQNSVEVRVERLSEIMVRNKHNFIDLIKMDIEGAEYDVIDDILKSGIKIGQLLVEFHHRFPKIGIKKTRDTIKKLRNAGFALFYVSDTGEEFSFINRDYYK
jgi:FkbM family methyltransferase